MSSATDRLEAARTDIVRRAEESSERDHLPSGVSITAECNTDTWLPATSNHFLIGPEESQRTMRT